MESGGCGVTERRGDGGRPRAGVAGGQDSVLRRKKEQAGLPCFQLRAPVAVPSQQPSADNQGVHGSLEPRDRAVMRVQENWCLEKGRPQECVRMGRSSSPDAPEPALHPKRSPWRRLSRSHQGGGGDPGEQGQGRIGQGQVQEDRGSPEPVEIRQGLSVASGSREGCSACDGLECKPAKNCWKWCR